MPERKSSKRRSKPKKLKKKKLTAATADRHLLYQKTVQNPGFEVSIANQVFKRRAGRKPLALREDFCGTALLCAKWVKSNDRRTATGIDIDRPTLDWGREHNIAPLGEAAQRVTLLEQDVLEPDPERRKHDVIMALNYSYFCFKDRATLLRYFIRAREGLVDDGLFFCDLFGGWEAQQVLKEERKHKGFRYTWHQADYNPITGDFLAHIHFKFPDKTKLKNAFTYDWRLWTIPELRELLREAGFEHIEVLWEGEDEDGEGNGEFRPRSIVENDPGYNAYLVASVAAPIERVRKPKRRKSDKASD